MDDNLINFNIECFSNKESFHHYKTNSEDKNNHIFNKDVNFYKKRIMEITRHLIAIHKHKKKNVENDKNIHVQPDIHINNDIKNTFDKYLQTCIGHLKNIDTNDIIQNEYIGTLIDNVDISGHDIPDNDHLAPLFNISEDDNIIMKQNKNIPNSLEKFVKKKTINHSENTSIHNTRHIIIPKKKKN